ncbi:MAG: NAD(+)/NADH kinase [Myxococcota bacterium]
MKRVLVVYKKTALQRYGDDDPRIKRLLTEGDASVASLRSAHEAHLDTIERARATLAKLGVKATFRHHSRSNGSKWDLVITLGGDGTLLWTSHIVDSETPVVAINSAPGSSVGYFCAGDRSDVENTIDAALNGKLRPTRLARMEVRIDGSIVHTRILNDILFCHRSPAATTRFLIRYGEVQESHTCSGIWAGPAAGSTAAQRSAGGRILPIGSQKLQWVVREVYRPGDIKLQLAKGLVAAGETLSIKSKMRRGRIYFDGDQKTLDIDIGSEITLRRSEESLHILGLKSRGR